MAKDVRDPNQAPDSQIKLRTLAPKYIEGQHNIYVRHLEDAVRETKNRNIALTGRYGAGKSSVLDDFEDKHEEKSLRVSINTLGPDEDDEDLTNRIQKELVKQLVYRLEPGRIRRSRFARPKPLTKRRAFFQALGVTVVGLGILWLLGVRPATTWPGAETHPVVQVSFALLFFCLVVLALWVARWLIGDRIVSEVTTAGTKIALGEGPTTYFDSFLDEIVTFFDEVEPEFVIFEDLDRFDDPQIFESLRELNTLINSSARWKANEHPLRFIYAIKDSLFEQLGAETNAEVEKAKDEDVDKPVERKPQLDVAAAAVQRANRTKFFELVIPMVPFISHRNARDHLVNALTSLGLPGNLITRPLLDLVARHTTDMRLMINICNEFAVFAEHLLWSKNPAPGMTADHLFALVVYKNFHLADFEAISQRLSTLDKLERHHRDQVRVLIAHLQTRRSKRQRTEEQRQRKEGTAAELGRRLRDVKDMFPGHNGWPYHQVSVDGQKYSFDAVDKVTFWEHVAKSKSFSVIQQHSNTALTPTAEQISRIFPEVMDSDHWLDPKPAELERLLQQYNKDIAILRGADFAGLARYDRAPAGQVKFDQHITNELKSELARDLVRRGFITRNYAEYSAIFYGSFVGVDVAFFYNHSVQPNEMYLDYEFTSKNAMSNLLEQVPADFTSTVSVLNIQVATYLLREKPAGAKELVKFIATHEGKDVQAFLEAFLNTPDAPRELLIQRLTEHPWREVFEFVASHPSIPDDETRLKLFDVALLNAQPIDFYEIAKLSRDLIRDFYPRLVAINAPQTEPRTNRIFSIMESVELFVNDLGDLSEQLREHVVAAHMYALSTSNLRLALEIENAPTLDEVRRKASVWEFCKSRINDYVEAVQVDESFEYLILYETVLVDIVNEQHESWTGGQLRDVVSGSADSAAISEIGNVPQTTWPLIVDAGLMQPTTANVSAYAQIYGVDEHLSDFLVPDDANLVELRDIESVEAEARDTLALLILNAAEHLAPKARVDFVHKLQLESAIDLTKITPSPDELLARALEAKLVPDVFETFIHFARGGWRAVSEAFAVSDKVKGFLSPAIVEDFVADFLESEQTPDELRRIAVEGISDYVPEDDARALRSAGRYACKNRIWLSLGEIRRIARITKTPDAVLAQLVHAKETSADDLAGVLASLGQPYEQLNAGPGVEFDLPAGSSNQTLFKRLQTAGRVEIVQKLIGQRRKVRTLL